MKHIKTYDNLTNIELKPGYMYMYYNYIICFLGDSNSGSKYPVLCLIFFDDIYFIEWRSFVVESFKPLNKHIKEFIIDNGIVRKTINAFEKHKFSSGPDKKGDSLKIIKKLKEELLSDKGILTLYDIEEGDIKKYNL